MACCVGWLTSGCICAMISYFFLTVSWCWLFLQCCSKDIQPCMPASDRPVQKSWASLPEVLWTGPPWGSNHTWWPRKASTVCFAAATHTTIPFSNSYHSWILPRYCLSFATLFSGIWYVTFTLDIMITSCLWHTCHCHGNSRNASIVECVNVMYFWYVYLDLQICNLLLVTFSLLHKAWKHPDYRLYHYLERSKHLELK